MSYPWTIERNATIGGVLRRPSTEEGILKRGTQPQRCPFNSELRYCGTWCPHFDNDIERVVLSCGGELRIILLSDLEQKDEHL